jgi:hypothetical protein
MGMVRLVVVADQVNIAGRIRVFAVAKNQRPAALERM